MNNEFSAQKMQNEDDDGIVEERRASADGGRETERTVLLPVDCNFS